MFTETISTECFQLIKDLPSINFVNEFALGGGTALALMLGHRKSIDLDFFSWQEFSPLNWSTQLSRVGDVFDARFSDNSYRAFINGVKVEFMYFAYQLQYPKSNWQGIDIIHPIDIAMFKLLALIGRNRKKDIIDLYFIDKEIIDLEELFKKFTAVYDKGDINLIKQVELLFDDRQINNSDTPVMLIPTDWDEAYAHVKDKLIFAIKEVLQI